MIRQDLETKFKNEHDPLRIVFVCAMWITGFDVPSLSTLYLDKPMRNHTLMQTIARANRVFGDKLNGLIVDYVGVFRDLQKALAIYGSAAGGGVKEGELPVQEKGELVVALRMMIEETAAFCQEQGIDPQAIQSAPAQDFKRAGMIQDAVDALLRNDEIKKKFLSLAGVISRLYKAILPDASANEFSSSVALFVVMAREIRKTEPEPDIADIMSGVEQLLDVSIASRGYVIRESSGPYDTGSYIDLSQIDFDALRAHFERSRKHIEAEKLRGSIASKLKRMLQLNKSRVNYQERFQQMIDEYNAGSANVELFFEELVKFARELNQEEQRHVAEQLSEEELAMFDLLTRPDLTLSEKEQEQIKKVVRDLLATLKREKLVLDWRKKQQARAEVRLTVEQALDSGLPESYSSTLYQRKCEEVFQHIYDSYFGQGQSIYTAA